MKHAKNASLGGNSHIRKRSDRMANLSEDQLVGQLGEFALCRWMRNEKAYWERREAIDKNPWVGDDGVDYPGFHLDVKTSLMRRHMDPSKYNLPVRPAERHDENVYILALVEPIIMMDMFYVWLIGWAKDEELPSPRKTGIFQGAHLMPVNKLHEMDQLAATIGYYAAAGQTKGI